MRNPTDSKTHFLPCFFLNSLSAVHGDEGSEKKTHESGETERLIHISVVHSCDEERSFLFALL